MWHDDAEQLELVAEELRLNRGNKSPNSLQELHIEPMTRSRLSDPERSEIYPKLNIDRCPKLQRMPDDVVARTNTSQVSVFWHGAEQL